MTAVQTHGPAWSLARGLGPGRAAGSICAHRALPQEQTLTTQDEVTSRADVGLGGSLTNAQSSPGTCGGQAGQGLTRR